jgi:hypothetical protein
MGGFYVAWWVLVVDLFTGTTETPGAEFLFREFLFAEIICIQNYLFL